MRFNSTLFNLYNIHSEELNTITKCGGKKIRFGLFCTAADVELGGYNALFYSKRKQKSKENKVKTTKKQGLSKTSGFQQPLYPAGTQRRSAGIKFIRAYFIIYITVFGYVISVSFLSFWERKRVQVLQPLQVRIQPS